MKKLLIGFMLLIMSVSCSTPRIIEKEVPMIETVIEYRNKELYDSTRELDSVFLYINGDTVYKYKEKTKLKYVYKTDTIEKIDSIPYPVTITETSIKEVNKTNAWQKLLMLLGGLYIMLLILKIKLYLK